MGTLFKGLLALCGIATVLGSCDRNYIGRLESGIISSPGFPFDYAPGQSCRLQIELQGVTIQQGPSFQQDPNPQETPPEIHVCFSFHRFSLSTGGNCTDYLAFDGMRYCGNGDVFPDDQPMAQGRDSVWLTVFCWLTTESVFNVNFVSEGQTPQRGFFAYFTVGDASTSLSLSPPCASGMFTCFNRNCVSPSSLCNYQDDCKDESDEDYANAQCEADVSLSACNFDVASNPTCGFKTPALNWRRAQDSPAGPRYDHTLGAGQPSAARGYFMYTYYLAGNSLAILDYNVPLDQTTSTRCLSYWYFMSGSVGTLSVGLKAGSTDGDYVIAWYRSGNHGSRWRQGQLQIPANYPRIFQVRFGAEKGQNIYSNIGLDDISITETACFGRDVSCAFELGLCGWENQNRFSLLKWSDGAGTDQQSTSGTDSVLTGPDLDRYGSPNGRYAYISAPTDASVPIATGTLLTTQMTSGVSSQHYCLSFWYHVSGSGFETFQVMLIDAADAETELWNTQSRLPASTWESSLVAIDFTGAFQVAFKASFSTNGGLAAIDDVILTPGSCSPAADVPGPPIDGGGLPVPYACPLEHLVCGSGECIYTSRVCNGHQDCSDNSDETDCPGFKSNSVVIVIAIIVILLLVLAIIIVLVVWWRYARGMPLPCNFPCLEKTPSVRPIDQSQDFPSYNNSWEDISRDMPQKRQVPQQQSSMPPDYNKVITGHGALHSVPNQIPYQPNGVGPARDRYAYTNPAAAEDDISRDFSTPTPSVSLPSWDSGHMDPAGTVTHSKRRRSLTDDDALPVYSKPMKGPQAPTNHYNPPPQSQQTPGRVNPAFTDDYQPRRPGPRNPPTSTPIGGAARPGNERPVPPIDSIPPIDGDGGQPLSAARLRDRQAPRGPMANQPRGPSDSPDRGSPRPYRGRTDSPSRLDTSTGRDTPTGRNGNRVSFGPEVSSETQI